MKHKIKQVNIEVKIFKKPNNIYFTYKHLKIKTIKKKYININ